MSNAMNDAYEEHIFELLTVEKAERLERLGRNVWEFVQDGMLPEDTVKEIKEFLERK